MIKRHCDGPKCERTTDADRPNPGWITAESDNPTLGRAKVRHYCSYKCEHDHTYLLISGDNGK